MKRLLLFALVAFFGVSAQAQNKPTVITEKPAGTETVYKRVSGKMFWVSPKTQLQVYTLKHIIS